VTGPIPVAETVMFPVRSIMEMFSVNVTWIVSFPVPDGVTVIQPASPETDQLVFDVTINVVFPAVLATFLFGGETLRMTGTPSCETVTVCDGTPDPVTVIWATRGLTEVFSVKVAKIVSLPVPEGVHYAPG